MGDVTNEAVGAAVEAVVVANVKTIAEMAAWSTAQSMANQVAHNNRVSVLAETYLARALKSADEVDPEQAAATLKLLTGNDLGQIMSALGNVVAALQQVAKTAQTTPPVTG